MSDANQVVRLAEAVRVEVAKAVVGQDAAVDGLLIGLLTGGHVLLEGVPGTAKTLVARSLAHALDATFKRIQFSPDLMPADVVGTSVYDASNGEFVLRRGPVFANLVLADEINRTPPKTQSALLEAMQERQVTIDGTTHALPDPFMVIATQNPVEYEGTYPLPEAQLDRFQQKLVVSYPSVDEESEILRRHVGGLELADLAALGLRAVASTADIAAARAALDGVTVDDGVVAYVAAIARATRGHVSVTLGASPRAAVSLLVAAKAHALLRGRAFVTPDDVKTLAPACLRHRLLLQPEVEIEGADTDAVLAEVLSQVPVPR
ncbi:MAG: MoxR family ATPase [Actinobacteria bacterium]|nr:MAG: MoxR family ATPase [Actinomycetota bacterium]